MISATSASGSEAAQTMLSLRSSRLLAVSCTLLSCYTYRDAAVGDAAIRAPVRVELTEDGSDEITGQVGPRGTALEGVLTARSDSSLIFGVTALTRRNGVEETWHGERVSVPISLVSRIQLRKFSRLNTALLFAGIFAGGMLVKTAADAGNVIGGPGKPPPGPGQ